MFATAANAAIITFINPSVPEYQQGAQNPCVIGDPSCSAGALGAKTLVPSGAFDTYSPYYTVGQIRSVVEGDNFAIGLDLNGNSTPQTIDRVAVYTNILNTDLTHASDTLLDQWVGTLSTEPLGGSGSGWSDITFLTFTLAGLDDETYITFRFAMSVENAGGDTLFLIKTPGEIGTQSDVPEPSSLLLMSGGLAVLYKLRRRAHAIVKH
jgi:hypothetical protein